MKQMTASVHHLALWGWSSPPGNVFLYFIFFWHIQGVVLLIKNADRTSEEKMTSKEIVWRRVSVGWLGLGWFFVFFLFCWFFFLLLWICHLSWGQLSPSSLLQSKNEAYTYPGAGTVSWVQRNTLRFCLPYLTVNQGFQFYRIMDLMEDGERAVDHHGWFSRKITTAVRTRLDIVHPGGMERELPDVLEIADAMMSIASIMPCNDSD